MCASSFRLVAAADHDADVSEQVRHETDFEREGRSAERIAKHIKDDPSLRNKIVVPDVVWKWTSPRVLTTDYTPGTRLTDGEELDAKGLNRKTAMDAVLEVFAAMIFRWGWVHCASAERLRAAARSCGEVVGDPHPGNVLVRKESSGKGLEIVSEELSLASDHAERSAGVARPRLVHPALGEVSERVLRALAEPVRSRHEHDRRARACTFDEHVADPCRDRRGSRRVGGVFTVQRDWLKLTSACPASTTATCSVRLRSPRPTPSELTSRQRVQPCSDRQRSVATTTARRRVKAKRTSRATRASRLLPRGSGQTTHQTATEELRSKELLKSMLQNEQMIPRVRRIAPASVVLD